MRQCRNSVLFLFIIFHLFQIHAQITAAPPQPVRNIAEYEPMEGVLISYPNKFGIPNALIKEMAEDAMVICATTDEQEVDRKLRDYGVNMDNVTFHETRLNSVYPRDFGPWWIVDGDSKIGIVDFEYNRNRPDDNKVNGQISSLLSVPVYKMDLVTCGGNYMTDGHLKSASTDLVWNENRNYSHNEIDEIMKEYLGIEKYHVVEDPNLTTDIDHIDCWGKFLAPDKILLREVPPSNGDYDEIEKAVAYWKSQTSSYGTPYKIFRITSIARNEGYTNSLILNNKVLVPISESSNDDPAIEVYKQAMPGYEIVGFTNDVQSWQNFDALHCRTKGIADKGMLSVRHIPLHDTVSSINGEGYAINVTIIAYSGESVIADSLMVYYKPKGAADFSSVKIENVSGNEYKAVIPQQAASGKMSYYVHAADESGRSENHPYIGAADSHIFYAESQGNAIQNLYAGINTTSFRNFPNPFVSETRIVYNLTSASENARISIFSNNGRLVRTWPISKNVSSVLWDGTDRHNHKVATGIYFYVVNNGDMRITRQMQMIK